MQKQSESETLAMREKIYMTVQESVIGAGTGNYNKLKNIPVVNLRGETPETCVVLSGLNPGTFVLSGYYKVVEDGPIFQQEEPVQIHSLTEETPGSTPDPNDPIRRVVYYIHYKNANLFIRMIVYYGEDVEHDFDICLTKPLIYWEEPGDDTNGNDDGDD